MKKAKSLIIILMGLALVGQHYVLWKVRQHQHAMAGLLIKIMDNNEKLYRMKVKTIHEHGFISNAEIALHGTMSNVSLFNCHTTAYANAQIINCDATISTQTSTSRPLVTLK